MKIDYHVHNHFSPDSQASTADLVQAEISHGVAEMCLTNHVEWFNKGEAKCGTFDMEEATRRFDSIIWELEQIRPQFPDFPILLGCELQWVDSWMDDLKTFVQKTPFDCVLGSVHIVDDVVISTNIDVENLFEKATEDHAYGTYFDILQKLVEWGHIDIVAHFDVVKKYGTRFYGPFNPHKYEGKIRPILKTMAQKDIGIELNTGALDRACKELFPHPVILKWALEEGVKHFTLSSDAHEPERAGKRIAEALKIAQEAGLPSISTYRQRKATRHPL